MLLLSMPHLITLSFALIVLSFLLTAPVLAVDDMANHVNGILDTLSLDFAAINQAAVSNEETNRRRHQGRSTGTGTSRLLPLPREDDMPTRLDGILDTLSLDAAAINNAVDSKEKEAAKEGKAPKQVGKAKDLTRRSISSSLWPRDNVPSTEQLLQSCP